MTTDDKLLISRQHKRGGGGGPHAHSRMGRVAARSGELPVRQISGSGQ